MDSEMELRQVSASGSRQSTGRDRRRLPFAAVSGAGAAGVFLSAVPSPTDLAFSLIALVAAITLISLPRLSRHPISHLVGALSYLAAVGFLVQAQGGTGLSGSFTLALLPVLWISLYGPPLSGAVVVTTSAGLLAWLAALAGNSDQVIIRKAGLWFLIVAGICVAIHQLRHRYLAAIAQRETTLS